MQREGLATGATPMAEAGERVHMMPVNTTTRLQSIGSSDDVEVLRRVATTYGAGNVLALLAELLSLEAHYCLLSGEPAKAATLARRAKILAQAAEAVAD